MARITAGVEEGEYGVVAPPVIPGLGGELAPRSELLLRRAGRGLLFGGVSQAFTARMQPHGIESMGTNRRHLTRREHCHRDGAPIQPVGTIESFADTFLAASRPPYAMC